MPSQTLVTSSNEGHGPLEDAMQARLSLTPGQKETKRLLDEYEERLVCLRYDEQIGKRLIVAES